MLLLIDLALFLHPRCFCLAFFVTESSERDHLENLASVLEKLEEAGIRLKKSKCHFMLPSKEYLGHKISNKDTQPVLWSLGEKQRQAFQEAKEALTSAKYLVHYDPSKKLILSCDASPYGVGAVLSHKLEDGTEHPMAFASRSLSPAEKKYAQLDKEGLAIVFGARHFQHYLLGCRFTIYSDHKPLHYLFSENKAMVQLTTKFTLACTIHACVYQFYSRD